MFFEYIQLSGYGGPVLSVDFIIRIGFLILCGLILVGVGFKIKGMPGALVALALGALYFLYNERIIRF
jgi:hypothetical protein